MNKCNTIITMAMLASANLSYAVTPLNNGPIIMESKLKFISVHPDDLSLTFGGLILNNNGFSGKKISIYEPFDQSNYMSGGSWASDYTNSRVADVTGIRMTEDLTAFNSLFKTWVNYKFGAKLYPENSLRNYMSGGNITDKTDFGSISVKANNNGYFPYFTKLDKQYYRSVYYDMIDLLYDNNCVVFAPLAAGNPTVLQHLDHFLVREAVTQAAHDLALKYGTDKICKIYFGEDQPYVNSDPAGSAKVINNFISRLHSNQKITYNIDAAKKWDVISKSYKSQIEYDDIYKEGVVIKGTPNETVYLWDKNSYSKALPDHSCNEKYCNYSVKY